jgi:alpha-tubulin suppressor-like RCC1 family protein
LIESNIKVIKIAAGHSHSGCINSKGDLYTWGCNIDHRLMQDNIEIEINSLNED